MEANKIKGEAKSLLLDNGVELTYCERGEQNREVLVCGCFYFHTFMPVIEALAKRFHVYGVVMRFDGHADEVNSDGTTNWTRQWGKDVYDFTQKLGLTKFHYVGKCHGTVPGWYLVKNHPEVLLTMSSFFLAPHVCPQSSNKWFDLMTDGNPAAMMQAALRKPEEGLKAKMEEMASIGSIDSNIVSGYVVNFAKYIWASNEECIYALKNMNVPVGYLFGTDDPFFEDHFDSNLFAIRNTKGARTVILGGEKHLMEIDCPERVANEVLMFIEEAGKHY